MKFINPLKVERLAGILRSPELGARVFATFTALAILKLVLLASLGKYLFQMHWRVPASGISWEGKLAFCVFVILCLLSMLRLGATCVSAGVNEVRAVNAIILTVAIVFAAFTLNHRGLSYMYLFTAGRATIHLGTFHANWIYIKNVAKSLTEEIFTDRPYLAVWGISYLLLYLLLVRARHEKKALYLTALTAAAYLLVNMRYYAAYRDELLLADGVGLCCLLLSYVAQQPLPIKWSVAPLVWALLLPLLYAKADPGMWYGAHYTIMIIGETTILFFLATKFLKECKCYSIYSRLLPFYFISYLLLTNTHYPTGGNFNKLLCLSLELPRYFMDESLLVIMLGCALGLLLYSQWNLSKWAFDIFAVCLISISVVDVWLVKIMGIRLGWDVLLFTDSATVAFRMAKPYLAGALLGITACGAAYLVALRLMRRLFVLKVSKWWLPSTCFGLSYLGLTFLIVGLLGTARGEADKAVGNCFLRFLTGSPFWKSSARRPMSRDNLLIKASSLGLKGFPTCAKDRGSPGGKDMNLVIIFMESSYNKYLSLFNGQEETQPLLRAYTNRMELFPNFFSTFAGSIQSRFCTFTSLFPVRDFNAFTMKRVDVKSIFEILHENGYVSSIFYSSFFDYTGFRDFLRGRAIDEMYDADTMPGQRTTSRVSWGLHEEETLSAICQQLSKYAGRKQKFALTYIPAAPHYPFDGIPPQFVRFKQRPDRGHESSYLNELLYMDWIIKSILDKLANLALLENTLIVITDDHGEMLGVNGGSLGHGWVVTPELTNIPLIIMNPQRIGLRINYTVGSQADLLPTILDCLDIPVPSSQLYEGQSLYSRQDPNRIFYLNSYEGYAAVKGHYIVCGKRISGVDEDGDPSDLTVYTLSNSMAHTYFKREPILLKQPVRIKEFDEFQEELLQDYKTYTMSLKDE